MGLLKNTNASNSNTGSVVVTPRNKQVRRQRINNDWQDLNEKPLNVHATTDEIFLKTSYENPYKQQGLLGKIEIPNKNTNTPENTVGDYYSDTASRAQSRNNERSQELIQANKKKHSKALRLVARAKATSVNASIMVWGGSLWFTLQLPFALISLVMLGLAGVINGATEANGILGWAASTAEKLIAGAASIVGIDASLTGISTSFFTVTYLLVLALGLLSIFAAFLQYTLAFLKPLSGEMAGLKQGTFLLVLFGYSTPLLNLFPWILLWMAVVWKYPK